MSTIPSFVIFGGEAVPIGAGSAPSVVGSGLWHSTLSALDSLAYIGANNQILVTNSAGTDTTWITAAGDITYAANVWTVTGLQGRAVSNSAPSAGQALVWNGSAWAPASTSGGALNAYGGDISATSSSNVQYIQSLSYSATGFGHGAVSPIAINGSGAALNWVDTQVKLQDSSTTVLQLGAASSDFIALGAAGPNAGLIRVGTGTLPINIIETTLSGGATPLMAIDGDGNLGFGLSVAATGVGANLEFFAQNAGGTGNGGGDIILQPGKATTNGVPGSVLVTLEAPVTGNNPTGLVVSMGPNQFFSAGPLFGTFANITGVYLTPGITPSSSNYSLAEIAGTALDINDPAEIDLQIGTSTKVTLNTKLAIGVPVGGLQNVLPYTLANVSIAVVAGSNNVLTASTAYNPILVFTGACNASATAITLPPVRTEWIADFSACTGLGSNTYIIQNNTTTKTITISSNTVHRLYSDGAAAVYNLTYS